MRWLVSSLVPPKPQLTSFWPWEGFGLRSADKLRHAAHWASWADAT